MATLRVYRGDQFVAPFELGESRVRIGRGTENQLVLEDRDKQVSRTHAEIRFERGQYLITDLNSQNGVWIGERQIKAEEALPPNVPVTIGPYRLLLMAEEPEIADRPAATPDPEGIEPTMLDEMPEVAPVPPRPAAAPPPRSVAAPPPPPPAAAPSASAAAPARTQAGKTAAAPAASSSRNLMIIAAAVAVLVLAVVAIVFFGRSKTPEPVDTVASSSSSSSSTTTTVPAAPTPEQVFQEHYDKAQALIAENNKNGARDENTAALAALPTEQRGLDQLKVIEAMVDPNAPPGTTTATNTAKPPPPTGPETLRVPAKPGESERDRGNRERTARGQLEDGRKALTEHRLDTAISQLQGALTNSGRPDFGAVPGEASSMLARAKKEQAAAIAAARNAAAQKALTEARALAGSDVLAAWQKLTQARGLDPEVEGIADLQSALLDQARTQGERALSSAKNLDIRPGRGAEAAAEYQRAVNLLEILPGGHRDLGLAKQRLSELKR